VKVSSYGHSVRPNIVFVNIRKQLGLNFLVNIVIIKNHRIINLIFQATQETTIGNSNPAIYKYVTKSTVLEGIRTMVANRMATTGNNWAETFSQYNSGTYVFVKSFFMHMKYMYYMCVHKGISELFFVLL
jgi:hypothetical protein